MKLKDLMLTENDYENYFIFQREEANHERNLQYYRELFKFNDTINGNFDAIRCNLLSLKGGPTTVYGNYKVRYNKLTSLQYGPTEVEDLMQVSDNPLKNLEYAPLSVTHFIARNTDIKSLSGIGKRYIKKCLILDLGESSIRSSILGLLLVEHLGKFTTTPQLKPDPFDIVRDHLRGERDILECQEELIEAGFKEYAKF